MAAGHPIWFRPTGFCRAVLNYSLTRIGWLPPETVISVNLGAEEVEAVELIGRAVFTLQAIIRNGLRQIFIESVSLDVNYYKIRQFMTQGYLEIDVFNLVLSNLAIIAELIIFLDEIGFPLPRHSYHIPWCDIYSHRLRDELASKGGFEKLLEVARRRYIDTGLHVDTLISFVNNIPIPYAEEPGVSDWPEILLEFVRREQDNPLPSNTTMAMNVLRKLYAHKTEMVPTP
ncbi:unnamed protein product [Larinioides sclopetarius]|uniref:Uncharacterized protein n=1 Tax=Larinioides sclopetarius TaxID=280406 RepID=A0AAV1Z9G9_9ARAC